jgi:hypothetical protein
MSPTLLTRLEYDRCRKKNGFRFATIFGKFSRTVEKKNPGGWQHRPGDLERFSGRREKPEVSRR